MPSLVCKPAQGCKVGVIWGGRASVHVLEEREAQSHANMPLFDTRVYEADYSWVWL